MQSSQRSGPSKRMSLLYRLLFPVILFAGVFSLSTLGYRLIDHYNGGDKTIWDCFYQTSILLTGVGFTDHLSSHDSVAGILFTTVMAFFGVGFLLWFMSTVTAFIVSGELSQAMRRDKMRKKIDALSGHFIVCGCGETGQHCIRELQDTMRPFVVVENDVNRVSDLEKTSGEFYYIIDDASEDEVLVQAGVERASGLISSLPNDKDNLLVVITARQLNPRLRIVSRCVEKSNENKLRKAGADSVVCQNMIGGMRIVSELVRPSVVTFLDTMLRDRRQIRIEEAVVAVGNKYADKSLAEANLHELADINVIAVKVPGGDDFLYNPQGNTKLAAGTVLVMIGAPACIVKVREAVETSG